jgi:sulfur-oxidizing protein SoxZ
MRIRATMKEDKVEVRVLMAHEMETGLRKDASDKPVPAHYIQNVSITHNGRTVLSAQWGTSISKNPFLYFRFKGGKAGDRIAVTWLDNLGDRRTDEALIAAAS